MDVKIDVTDLRPPELGFTSLDVIQGEVLLNVVERSSVYSIGVKLKGISRTLLRRSTMKDDYVKDTHLFLHETKILLNEKTELRTGQHSFNFKFKLPLTVNCTNCRKLQRLPPSLKSIKNTAGIHYRIEAYVIKRSSFISKLTDVKSITINVNPFNDVSTLHKSQSLNYTRNTIVFKDKLPEIVELLETSNQKYKQHEQVTNSSIKLAFTKKKKQESSVQSVDVPILDVFDIPIHFEVRTFGYFVTVGQPLKLQFFLLSPFPPFAFKTNISGSSSGLGAFYLRSFSIILTCTSQFRAGSNYEEWTEDYVLLTKSKLNHKLDLALSEKSPNNDHKTHKTLYELEIPIMSIISDSNELVIPDIRSITPNFRICNIERKYELWVGIELSTTKQSKKFSGIDVKFPVDVLSGIPPPLGEEIAPPVTTGLPSYEDVLLGSV